MIETFFNFISSNFLEIIVLSLIPIVIIFFMRFDILYYVAVCFMFFYAVNFNLWRENALSLNLFLFHIIILTSFISLFFVKLYRNINFYTKTKVELPLILLFFYQYFH